MKALIVDDEQLARARLARLLRAIDGVEVVGEAVDGHDALRQIRELDPDVVFLDIRMPGLDGLAVAASRGPMPPIIFTTAFHEHAVEAFEVGAIDYLLKPIQPERLTKAVARLRARASSGAAQDVERALCEVLRQDAAANRVCARQGRQLHVFDARQIGRFFATDKYTSFVHEGREYLLEESLAQLEKRLGGCGFQRVHRSEVVNLAHVRALASEGSHAVVVLADGQRAKVSRRLYAALKRSLGSR